MKKPLTKRQTDESMDNLFCREVALHVQSRTVHGQCDGQTYIHCGFPPKTSYRETHL